MCEPIKKGNDPDTSEARFYDPIMEEPRFLPDDVQMDRELKKAKERILEEIEKGKKIELDFISEKKFMDDVIESIPELFYVVDDKLRMVKWNKNVEMVTGYSADELQNMSALNFFTDEDKPLLRKWVGEVSSLGKSTLYRNYKYKDGTILPYFFTGLKTTINGKDYQIGVGIDCSEIEKAREALRETEEKLALAADSADAGLWALDIKTGELCVTQKCLELHDLNSSCKMYYNKLLATIHPIDQKAVVDAVRGTIKTGQDLKEEYRVVLSNYQYRWIVVKGRLLSSSRETPEHIAGVFIDITSRKLMENQLKEKIREVVKLKKQLEKDNVYLREEVSQLYDHEEIIGESKAFKDVLIRASQVASTNSTVLIIGETGTGKEVLARMIHNLSQRRDRPLVTVNCASLPPSLIEGELFGRERGAYTGALTKMNGRFEMADGSTLFLDEIGELPYELQAKLLRAIELGQFERLGSTKTIHVNVRIIAATNRNLPQAIRENKFRSDLYYRLNVFPISIPPLRERREDIAVLVRSFVRQYEKILGKHIESIPPKTMEALNQYMWYGNVRELKNVIEHAMIISDKTLKVLLPNTSVEEVSEQYSHLKDLERKHICEVLAKTGWRVSGPHGAAEILGLKRTTLMYKMKALGIKRWENEETLP